VATGGTAAAQTYNGTVGISAEVLASCTIGAASLDFGQYTSGQTADLDVQGIVNYSGCTAGLMEVEFDAGLLGDTTSRQMADGTGNMLRYQIFQTSARNRIWGEASQSQTIAVPSTGDHEVVIHGRVMGGQNVPAGSYTDTVAVAFVF
jgi:spore coat protein U-like protein